MFGAIWIKPVSIQKIIPVAFFIVFSSSAMAVANEITDVVDEPIEEEQIDPMVTEESEEAPPAATEIQPQVYIVPLGNEMNLKVIYEHPMDFEGGQYLESIQMEKTDGTFLGLKQFHAKSPKAYAEFLVNPELADFKEVVLVAESSIYGTIKSVIALEFTPEEALPDEYNPQMIRQKALEQARAEREKNLQKGSSAVKEKSKTDKDEDGKEKKLFGLF